MAESLGELIVKISADVSDLKDGLLDAQNKVKETSDKIGESLGKIGTGFTVLGAAITGAFTLAIKSSVDFSEQLIILSQRTGINVEELSQLKYGAEQVGMSIEELANGLKFLERNAFNALEGNTKLQGAFEKMGISVSDTNGQLKTGSQLLLDMADRFSHMPDGPEKTAIAMQLMGRAGVAMIPILNQGAEGIKKMEERATELEGTFSDADAKGFRTFNQDLKDMDTAFGGLTRRIAADVIPAIEDFIKFVTNIIVTMREWAQQHPVLSSALANLVLGLGIFLTVVGSAALAVKAFTFTFGDLLKALPAVYAQLGVIYNGLIAFIFSPLGLIIIVLTSLTAAWIGNWGNMRDVVANIARSIGDFLDWINEKVMFTTIFLQNLANNLKNNWQHPMEAVKESFDQASASIEAFKSAGGENLGDKFANGIKTAGKATDDLVSKLKSFLPAFHDVSKASDDMAKELGKNIKSNTAEWQYLHDQIKSLSNQSKNLFIENTNTAFLNEKNRITENINLAKLYQQTWTTAHSGVKTLVLDVSNSIQTNLSGAISDTILGVKSAHQAFVDLGKAMIKTIVDWLTQKLVAMALTFALEKSGLLASVAAATTAGAAITAAYAPAALVASIATFGAADAAAAAGFGVAAAAEVTALGATKAAGAVGLAEGTDTVPSMLSPGEMVVPNSFASALRDGNLTLGGPGGSGGGDHYQINVNVKADVNSTIDIDKMASQIGLRIEQKLRRIR